MIQSSKQWFLDLRLWQKIVIGIGGVILSYGSYFWLNYRELFLLRDYTPQVDTNYEIKNNLVRLRVINLDGALTKQTELMELYKPELIDLNDWGPYMRIDCSFRYFWNFEKALSRKIGSITDDDPAGRPLVNFYGSNDYHHIALPLIRRFRTPFNLILLDNHPDWFQYYTGMHCGCWFTQAVSLPTCQMGFHFGGCSGEFLDTWSIHPWKELREGKIAVFPTISNFSGLKWEQVKYQQPIRDGYNEITEERIRELLEPFRESLAKYPLYITLDKDCIYKHHNYQNWNSGNLGRLEVIRILKVLLEYSGGRLLALDITGEFTEVRVNGVWRHYLHKTQHEEELNTQPQQMALETNQETNLTILKFLESIFTLKRSKSGPKK